MTRERHASTPGELKERLGLERAGTPFLQYRDASGSQILLALGGGADVRSIGRDGATDVSLPWDLRVSRLHATLERAGGTWTIVDDGLSTNGTFVNLERVAGRRALRPGDVIGVGGTEIAFCAPAAGEAGETALTDLPTFDSDLSRMQRKVLVALCRPLHAQGPYAAPATNQEIADEVVLSLVAVKTHLRTLYGKFGLAGLPQNRKRAALAEAALRSGVLADRDFGP